MSGGAAIRVRGLGKRYRIPAGPARPMWPRPTAFEAMAEAARSVWGGNAGALRGATEEVWAVRDATFEAAPGEVLGIIGRNGAGKSTLLKLLSRITEPTEGRIELDGRVASLLEVGTGFHPELTGRENVFLNGAILGMARGEIRRKFDEIVAFAGVEQFLETPVKRYSSGMRVRLAFAVAAHLEPEILVVDEVLAVGDAPFQRKCLGKMAEVSGREGRTVLFVSHQMDAVARLCPRILLMRGGRIAADGPAAEVVAEYLREAARPEAEEPAGPVERPRILGVRVDHDALARGELRVAVRFASPFPLAGVKPGIVVHDEWLRPVFGTNPELHGDGFEREAASAGTAEVVADLRPLNSGSYTISAWLGDFARDYDRAEHCAAFEYANPTGPVRPLRTVDVGPLNTAAKWTLSPVDSNAP